MPRRTVEEIDQAIVPATSAEDDEVSDRQLVVLLTEAAELPLSDRLSLLARIEARRARALARLLDTVKSQ
ncbi:MAG TPA: hypothetical protein VJX68_02390 [Candidatus Binatus sp.]|uniref:hypothetical protein n=1 Tax=Candidatus Binatus sp. TaxID=2811406 RepID=UPI002B48E3AB|nr:hypothetical protein [Candidatus Binatus sp.]HKN12018.1 hypothetical protein [Candidatus Binatus sp.]